VVGDSARKGLNRHKMALAEQYGVPVVSTAWLDMCLSSNTVVGTGAYLLSNAQDPVLSATPTKSSTAVQDSIRVLFTEAFRRLSTRAGAPAPDAGEAAAADAAPPMAATPAAPMPGSGTATVTALRNLTVEKFVRICSVIGQDPAVRYSIDFALSDGLAYLGLHISSRFGLWSLVQDCIKELVPCFYAFGKSKYQTLLLHQLASRQRMSRSAESEAAQSFSVSIKVFFVFLFFFCFFSPLFLICCFRSISHPPAQF
jgi:hypothetical protein